jgi:S1-C subfamily serine protease
MRPGAQFCPACGTKVGLDRKPQVGATSHSRFREMISVRWILAAVLVAALVGGVVSAVDQHRSLSGERRDRAAAEQQLRQRVSAAEEQITALEGQDAALAKRVQGLSKRMTASGQGLAPLAKRVLQSIFTVEGQVGQGTAWAAWQNGGYTYLLTANHVVADELAAGLTTMNIKQADRTWTGTIGRTDDTNDLAVIRVRGLIGRPLWQHPSQDISPLPGDELLLVGSPYGLEGTVTTGVVSRVTYDAIQTDAAANPGNSGGPVIDRQGRVVGVLVYGGGENLNFAIPVQRACVTVRRC